MSHFHSPHSDRPQRLVETVSGREETQRGENVVICSWLKAMNGRVGRAEADRGGNQPKPSDGMEKLPHFPGPEPTGWQMAQHWHPATHGRLIRRMNCTATLRCER